ncbi:tetratricopeptide repeat protein [Photobacterium minamisatsumaniensis]
MMKRFAFVIALVLASAPVLAELSQFTAGRVQRANTLQQEEKLDEAIALLKDLDPSRAYDQAFVQRMLGVFYWQQGNLSPAIDYLSKAVKSGLLQDEQAWVTQRMLADILLSDEKFKQALPHYYALTKSIPDTQKADELWLRIAQAHYQVEEWQPVLKAIEQHKRFASKVDVQPLTIKLGAQLQLKQWKASIPTLEALIALEPEKVVWWQQLAGIQLRLGQSKNTLGTLAMAKRQGVELSQQDLKTLGQLYAQNGVPERAARLYAELDNAETDKELVSTQAQYWQMAKEWEKAIGLWQLAAKLDSQYRWPLAQLLLQEGHYEAALAQLNKVSDRKREVEVELAKVRAYYKLTDFEQAIIHAKRADNIKSSSASQSWIKYLSQMRKMNS